MLKDDLEREMSDVAMSIFWDPVVINICTSVGAGEQLELCLGGKRGPSSGLSGLALYCG